MVIHRKVINWSIALLHVLAEIAVMADNSPQVAAQRLTLAVGQDQIIDLGSSDRVRVSRRSIIDLQELRNSRWQIVGLKPGFVVVSAENHGATSVAKLFVTVVKHRPEPSQTQRWYCALPEIHCPDGISPVGQTDSVRQYFAISQDCHKDISCDARIAITDKGRRQLSKFFSGGDFQVDVSTNGNFQITDVEPCRTTHQKIDDFIATKLGIKKGLVLTRYQCVPSAARRQIMATVMLKRQDQSSKIGLDMEGLNPLKKGQPLQISTILNAIDRNANFQILTQPQLEVMDYQKTVLKSGGEIGQKLLVTESKKYFEGWKSFGLELEIETRPLNDSILISYRVAFRSTPDQGRKLLRHEINGTTTLKAGSGKVVASIPLITTSNRKESLPIIGEVPILKPILATKDKQEIKQNVLLMLAYPE